MNSYAKKLINYYKTYKNNENAEQMKKYLRNQFEFLGIKTPERNELLKKLIEKNGKPKKEELHEIIWDLWNEKEREFAHVALTLLEKEVKKLDETDLIFIEKLVVTKSWWDTVDTLATRIIGLILKRHPDLIPKYTIKWNESDNMWLNRTAILFQLKYKQETNEKMLYQYILKHQFSDEFFIQKAIGWALREYSKTNEKSVIDFVKKESLKPLSTREALKVIKKKGTI